MTEVFIGLGANLDQPLQQIQRAIQALRAVLTQTEVADYYRSKPLGPQDQPDFINTVIRGHTDRSARELLRACQAIEHSQQRVRIQHWGPRTIDLDILYYGGATIAQDDLVVPHPEIMNRTFVLRPLLDLQPNGLMPTGDRIDPTRYDFSALQRIDPNKD